LHILLLSITCFLAWFYSFVNWYPCNGIQKLWQAFKGPH